MAPFIFVQSGLPYNVVSGVDTNNDGNPSDDRPAFAQNLSRPSVINEPGYGVFDTAPGTLRTPWLFRAIICKDPAFSC